MSRFLLLGLVILAGLSGGPVLAESPVDQVVEVRSDAWNSLEVVRLIISLLTPVVILGVSLWMDRRIKELEHHQWSNQKVIEKRLEVYEEITPRLNELMCYFTRVGSWKEHDPTAVIDMKRDLDKIAHVYAPLFSPRFLTAYYAYMECCFAMFRGAGRDAQLRTEVEHYRDAYNGAEGTGDWIPEWDDCFTGAEEAVDRADVRRTYGELVGTIAEELGVLGTRGEG